jgi:hypothetical protein
MNAQISTVTLDAHLGIKLGIQMIGQRDLSKLS